MNNDLFFVIFIRLSSFFHSCNEIREPISLPVSSQLSKFNKSKEQTLEKKVLRRRLHSASFEERNPNPTEGKGGVGV